MHPGLPPPGRACASLSIAWAAITARRSPCRRAAIFSDGHADAELVLVGTAAALQPAAGWQRCTRVVATEVVAMDDAIEVALRRKRDSSMRVAIAQLKADASGAAAADVCVCAGNTGALMAVARYVLKTFEGIDRPAIAALLPNARGGLTKVLDLGANVDCSAEHLLQFALMGSALVGALDGIEEPTVGLLNIGEEAIKGSETIKRAAELMRQAHAEGLINFFGNVEGNDVYKGTNRPRGLRRLRRQRDAQGVRRAGVDDEPVHQDEFTRSIPSKLAALVAMPVLRRFATASTIVATAAARCWGCGGLVFKAHGSSDAFGFERRAGARV